MKTISIYYDKVADELTFARRKHYTAPPIGKVTVPDGTRRDGDCVLLPDAPTAVFKGRRVTPLELYIRAVVGWGEGLGVVEARIHGFHTFSMHGKAKAGKKTTTKAGS